MIEVQFDFVTLEKLWPSDSLPDSIVVQTVPVDNHTISSLFSTLH